MNLTRSRKFAGYLEGWLSVVINTALFGAKLLVGRSISSVAMVADAWHTLSDSFTSILVILGFWFSARPADDRHHFGHGRAEAIGSIIIGTLLAVVGVNFFRDSLQRLIHHQATSFSRLAILIFFLSAILKEGLAFFSFWLGKKINSASLVADAWHHRSDSIASALIVVAATFGNKFWWMDGVLGLGVSGLILLATATIFRRSISYLLGESPSSGLEARIKETILEADDRLRAVHHLHLHEYGEHRELTVHVRLPAEMNLDEAHAIASQVEKNLKEKLALESTIHLEPGHSQASKPQEKKDQEEKGPKAKNNQED